MSSGTANEPITCVMSLAKTMIFRKQQTQIKQHYNDYRNLVWSFERPRISTHDFQSSDIHMTKDMFRSQQNNLIKNLLFTYTNVPQYVHQCSPYYVHQCSPYYVHQCSPYYVHQCSPICTPMLPNMHTNVPQYVHQCSPICTSKRSCWCT